MSLSRAEACERARERNVTINRSRDGLPQNLRDEFGVFLFRKPDSNEYVLVARGQRKRERTEDGMWNRGTYPR